VKRVWRGLGLMIVAGGLAALAVAWVRPAWLPPWARPDPARLPSWMRPGSAAPSADDESGAGGRGRDEISTDRADPNAPRIVRLASPRLARRIGIETAPVALERLAHRLACTAEAAYDGRRSAEITARVAGIVREARAEPGQVVRKGEVLAVLESAAVGTAKVQLHTARDALELARVTYERTRRLTQEKAAPGKAELENRTALNQAQAALLDAEQKVRNLGFADADLARLARSDARQNLLEVVAPIDGHVIAWDATPGEAVEPTTQLFALADTRAMWLWIDVHEADIAAVAVGQPVEFVISGTDAPVFAGEVTSVGTEVNAATRTTRVRAALANPEGRLRANQFGRATIRVAPEHEARIVPAAAVQRDGQAELVFLPLPDGASFRAQPVDTRPTDRADAVEVVRGLEPGQRVVTTGAFLLLSELLKDAIPEDVD